VFVPSFLGRFLAKDIGIDLGTATSLVYVRGEGIVLAEPSVVAVYKGTSRVLLGGEAVGEVAKAMLGKTPGNIEAIRPMRDGVIADYNITEAMLRYFIRKVQPHSWGLAPQVVIAVPSGITSVEKTAVRESAKRAGASQVHLICEPKAAAIGVGLPVGEPVANMIVDIGGGTTEVAVISLGGIVTSESLRIAGDEFDEAIVDHMRRTYNLMIGESSAERVKIELGSAYPLEEERTMVVKGRDLIAGLPRTATIRSEEVREALKGPVESILGAIKQTLERTPPELSADLIDRGITLAGGGSLLRGLDRLIGRETGLPVAVADDPMTAVVRGTGAILEDLDRSDVRELLESEAE
jgi:rod shape-determining protein MreB